MPILQVNNQNYPFTTYATVGRSSKCTVSLPDIKLSRIHCEIIQDDEDYLLIDLRSQNGIKLNDIFVTEAILKHGDKITLGRTEVVFLLFKPE